jgi:hypothetical protein
MISARKKAAADEAPRQAALVLLPFLLSNPPFIPASFTSTSLNRRHQILETNPENVEEYLVTDTYPTDFPTATRSVELLRSLASLIEEQGSAVIGKIQYKCPEKDNIIVGVELGLSESPLLLLLLKLEGDHQDSDGYKYDNLLPIDVVPGPWLDSFDEAVEFRKTTTEMTERLSRAFPDDNAGSRKTSGTTLDILQSQHDRLRQDDLLPAEEEEAQGGGEYIIDANEFWEGFDSDGDEPALQNGHKQAREDIQESDEERHRRMQAEEDRYWEMYDQTGALAASGHNQAAAARSNGNDQAMLNGDGFQGGSDLSQHLGRLSIMRSRNDAVKLMMKDAFRLMQGASGQVDENDFLKLAREAVREIQQETNEHGR